MESIKVLHTEKYDSNAQSKDIAKNEKKNK